MSNKMDDEELIIQIQKRCLEMLEFFNNYAQKHKFVFYMSGGTLLGAVRHRGFIPWDDDVDLMLPRDDYERLIRDFPDGRYHLSSCEKESDYNTPFARLWDTETTLQWKIIKDKNIGVFIDLFPIDGFPSGKIKTRLHLFHIKMIRTLVNSSIRLNFREEEKYKLVKRLIKLCFNKSGNCYSKRLNYVAEKFNFSKSSFVGVKTTTDHLFKEKNDKQIFENTIWMQFEDIKLPAPSGYDSYLRHLYGDYMTLPPVEKRFSEHQFMIQFYTTEEG